MKKLIISGLIIILLATGALMASCTSAQSPEITPIKIGGGSLGGTWFPMMTATMVVLNENIPEIVSTVVPGSSLVNARKLHTGELDVGLTYVSTSYDAFRGEPPFDGVKHTTLRALGKYIPSPYSYGVRADSDIYSIADLKDKKIVAGRTGSGTELAFGRVLAEYGLTYDSIKAAGGAIEFLPYGAGFTAFQDRVVAMTIFDGSPPDPHIVEIEAIAFPVRILSLDEDVLERMAEKYGYVWATNPGGAYKGTPDAVNQLYSSPMVAVRAGLSDDLVYKMTKAIFENAETLGKRHSALAQLDAAKAVIGVKIPFHPGAARYFKELGIEVESKP